MHAEYVAEMARQLVYEQFKEDTYTRGLNVFTTITKADQDAAYLALRRGVMEYEKRHPYRGPEAYIDIPKDKEEADEAIEAELAEHPDSDDIVAAIVLSGLARPRRQRGDSPPAKRSRSPAPAWPSPRAGCRPRPRRTGASRAAP